MTTVTIPSHFHGPPTSGNGGYTCGVAAAALGSGTARVRLLVPPPLDRPLAVEHRGETVVLVDGDVVVAEARPAAVDVEPPEPVGYEAAAAAREHFDVDAYAAAHAFPTCFTCGPGRGPDEGLHFVPAQPEDRPDLVVSPWVPDTTYCDDDGLVRAEVLWAALDCPSGLAWIARDADVEAAVLGQFAVEVLRRPSAGERLVLCGWQAGAEGRRRHSGSAVWTEAGDLLAKGEATWIVLAGDQLEAFLASAR